MTQHNTTARDADSRNPLVSGKNSTAAQRHIRPGGGIHRIGLLASANEEGAQHPVPNQNLRPTDAPYSNPPQNFYHYTS